MRAFRPRDIFHLRRLYDVAIAPDGASVAYSLGLPDPTLGGYQTCIYRLGTDDRSPRPLTRGPADRRPWFAPDGRHLAFLRHDGDAAQVHLLPLAGGEALQITALRHGVDAYAWGPHGRQIAALATVGPTGPTTRQLYHFDLDGTWRQLSDDAFDHRDATFAPDGRHIACLLLRAGGGVAIGRVAVDGGPWQLLTPWQALWARPVFAPDGSCLYAVGAGDGEEPRLWRVLLAGDAPESVAEAPWPDAFWPYVHRDDGPGPDLFVPGDGQGLLGLLYGGREPVLARCNLLTGRWQAEQAQGSRIQSFAATAAGDRMALLAGPPDRPPEVLLRDESGHIALRSDHHDLFLADASFAPVMPLADSTPGTGLLLPPPGRGSAPLVVVLADRADAATGGASSLLAQALCGRGLSVLRLPLDAGAAAAAAGDPRALSRQLESLIALCAARPEIDAARLGIVGEGVGGYLSLLLLAREGAFRAAATLGAATDLVSLWGGGDLPGATALRDLPPPWQAPERYIDLSPLLQAPRITAPLLLVQGSDDLVVPASQARELEAALTSLGRVVRLELYKGLGHLPLSGHPLRLQAQVLELVAGWLFDHLAQ